MPTIYRILLIFLVLAGTVTYALYQKKSMEAHLNSSSGAVTVLKELPQGQFMSLNSESFNLHQKFDEYRPKLWVVHFWGTWCAPCEAELPELIKLIKLFEHRQDVQFLLVAVNDELVKVKKHIATLPKQGPSVIWLIDNQNIYRDIFGTTRVPETYVFSSDKKTLKKYVGPQDWNRSMFFNSFDEFLQISTTKL